MHAVAHHNEYAKQGPFIHHHSDKTGHQHDHHSEYAMVYSDEIEDKIDLIIAEFRKKYPDMENMRWHAIKMLEQDETVMNQYPVELEWLKDQSYEKEIINQKYDFIEEVIEETLANKSEKEQRTDRIDRVMTGKWTGLPVFLVIMALVFFLTFTIGDWLKGYFEAGLELLTGAAGSALEAWGVSPALAVPACRRHYFRCGRHSYFPAEYFYPVSCPGFSGGQRIHVPGCFCHGRHHGQAGTFRQSVFAHAPRIRMFCSGCYGVPGSGRQPRPAEDDPCDAVYVLQRQTSDLRAVFLDVFRKIRHACMLFHVSSGNCGCHCDGVYSFEN